MQGQKNAKHYCVKYYIVFDEASIVIQEIKVDCSMLYLNTPNASKSCYESKSVPTSWSVATVATNMVEPTMCMLRAFLAFAASSGE